MAVATLSRSLFRRDVASDTKVVIRGLRPLLIAVTALWVFGVSASPMASRAFPQLWRSRCRVQRMVAAAARGPFPAFERRIRIGVLPRRMIVMIK
jgi:hypothetical protein